jgi:hypothetical protein
MNPSAVHGFFANQLLLKGFELDSTLSDAGVGRIRASNPQEHQTMTILVQPGTKNATVMVSLENAK